MWKTGLFGHFVDFEKAFDSIHRESLWNIMRRYGIPDKMVRVIAEIYLGFEFTVVDGSVTSEWFIIKSGVKWVPHVGISIFTLLGLGREEGNSKQEKRDKVKFQNSAGRP